MEVFNLRWDEYHRIVIDSFWSLFTEESLVDCTLVSSLTSVINYFLYFFLDKSNLKKMAVNPLVCIITYPNTYILSPYTQVCSPTETVKVHRIVLSANSPYFRSLLATHTAHPHPIIILHDVRYSILKMLITFMYR